MRSFLSSPRLQDACLFAVGIAVIAMMIMVIGHAEVPQ